LSWEIEISFENAVGGIPTVLLWNIEHIVLRNVTIVAIYSIKRAVTDNLGIAIIFIWFIFSEN